jgi:hypothetical protein
MHSASYSSYVSNQFNKLLILLVMRFSANPPWGVFWHSYFVLADNYDDFIVDYCTAWKIQPGTDSEIVLFMDNGQRLIVPCSMSVEDEELLKHLHVFYDLIRIQNGIFELFGPRSSQRIDVVEVSHPQPCHLRVQILYMLLLTQEQNSFISLAQ